MKKLLILCLTSSFIFAHSSTCFANTTAEPHQSYSLNLARKDDIRYQYKKVNGETYRRLYNFTTKTPLTNWEKVS